MGPPHPLSRTRTLAPTQHLHLSGLQRACDSTGWPPAFAGAAERPPSLHAAHARTICPGVQDPPSLLPRARRQRRALFSIATRRASSTRAAAASRALSLARMSAAAALASSASASRAAFTVRTSASSAATASEKPVPCRSQAARVTLAG